MQIYSFPDGDFKDVATRFTLPAQAVAYSPSGSTLAAAGDDEGIKLINAADRKVCRIWSWVCCINTFVAVRGTLEQKSAVQGCARLKSKPFQLQSGGQKRYPQERVFVLTRIISLECTLLSTGQMYGGPEANEALHAPHCCPFGHYATCCHDWILPWYNENCCAYFHS